MRPDHHLRGDAEDREREREHAGVQHRQSPPEGPERHAGQAHQRRIVNVVA